jgi:hypothetical protein
MWHGESIRHASVKPLQPKLIPGRRGRWRQNQNYQRWILQGCGYFSHVPPQCRNRGLSFRSCSVPFGRGVFWESCTFCILLSIGVLRQGLSPWNGINALDGMISAFNNVNALRQSMLPGTSVHGQIREGGKNISTIPSVVLSPS